MKKTNRHTIETPNQPIKKKEDIQKNNDPHIDQDFTGFPHNPSAEHIINPKTATDHIIAENSGEEKDNAATARINTLQNEEDSDGSASAFSATENFTDEDETERIEDK